MTQYLSIGAVTKYIKAKFDRDPYLERVYIKGELSNTKHHSSGHIYFRLKDNHAVLDGVMYKGSASRLSFTPKNGDQVLIEGRISVYEPRGNYQIYVDQMSLDGIGQLYERYEALKKELGDKGYFSKDHKKILPKYPKSIAVITAATGAAIQDIRTTLERRFPLAQVEYFAATVQGAGAVSSIVENIERADSHSFDVIIVGRGGGSIEDLWAFNEKAVVEAIYNAETPIISAVGHETDTTLSDYVADLRAPTPTGAAELATPDQFDLLNRLKSVDLFLMKNIEERMKYEKVRLIRYTEHPVLRNPNILIEQKMQRVDDIEQKIAYRLKENYSNRHSQFIRVNSRLNPEQLHHKRKTYEQQTLQLTERMERQMKHQLLVQTQQLNHKDQLLKSLNPTGILNRGYSIVRTTKGIVSSVSELSIDEQIEVQISDGTINATIQSVKEDKHG